MATTVRCAIVFGRARVREEEDRALRELILMDVKMPRVDGLEATRRIRALEAERGTGAPTPIVALTAAAFAEDERRCRDAGMDAYLSKPIKAEELHRVLGMLASAAGEPVNH